MFLDALRYDIACFNRWPMARDANVTEVLIRPARTDVEEDVFGTVEPAKDLCCASEFFTGLAIVLCVMFSSVVLSITEYIVC